MRTSPPLGVIRPLALGLGNTQRRWRRGPLVPMIWRRGAGPPAAQAVQIAAPGRSVFAPTYIFNLSLVWPAGTATRIETLRTQLVARTHRGPDTSQSVAPAERRWTRLEKTVLNFTHRAQTAPARRETTEAPPVQAPATRLPRLPARAPTRLTAASASNAPRARAGAIQLWARQSAMTPIPETPLRGEAAAAALARRPDALVWRRENAGRETIAASTALPRASARPAVERVWRRPAPGEAGSETGAARELASPRAAPAPAVWRGEAQAGAASPTAPAAMPPVEMGRLVDEVVRRLDRIGRDERLRRGL